MVLQQPFSHCSQTQSGKFAAACTVNVTQTSSVTRKLEAAHDYVCRTLLTFLSLGLLILISYSSLQENFINPCFLKGVV